MKLVVRFVNDHKSNYMWFEEKLDNGQWIIIKCTKAACEGNSRYALEKEIEKRRQLSLAILRTYGKEEEYIIGEDKDD